MISKLGLKAWLKERVYSIIYSFSQDGEHRYRGSLWYLSKFSGHSKRQVWKVLMELVESGLIKREEREDNWVKFVDYWVNLDAIKFQGIEKSSMGGIEKSSTHNTIVDNISIDESIDTAKKDDITDEIVSNDNEKIYEWYYWARKWINRRKCDRLIKWLVKQWYTLDDIYKSMILSNCEYRMEQSWRYVPKLQTWLEEFQVYNDEYLEMIVLKHKNKRRDDEVYRNWLSEIVHRDLTDTFGRERIEKIWKQK